MVVFFMVANQFRREPNDELKSGQAGSSGPKFGVQRLRQERNLASGLGLCIVNFMNIQPLVKRAPLALMAAALWLANSTAADTPQAPLQTSVTHVGPKQAQQLISDKKVLVLDLRTPKEFNAGHIAGATNIDFLAPDFEERVKGLDKTKPYLIHCAVGGRSSHSLPTFKRQQFQSIYHLDGGIQAWEKAGLPVQK